MSVLYPEFVWRHEIRARDITMTDARKRFITSKLERLKRLNAASEKDELDKSI